MVPQHRRELLSLIVVERQISADAFAQQPIAKNAKPFYRLSAGAEAPADAGRDGESQSPQKFGQVAQSVVGDPWYYSTTNSSFVSATTGGSDWAVARTTSGMFNGPIS